jgi:hypothetical protein
MVSDRVEHGFSSDFCPQCGEKTIKACPNCNVQLKGDYYVENVIGFGSSASVKPYCYACGKPYPWVERKLAGIAELADAIEELTSNERDVLHELMPNIIEETPRTPAAGLKISMIISRVTGPAKKVLSDAIVSIAVDAGKKALGLT